MKTKNKCKKDHKYNWNECGYGGGPDADVFCDKCGKFVLVPIEVYKKNVPYLYNLWVISQIDPNNEILKPIKSTAK